MKTMDHTGKVGGGLVRGQWRVKSGGQVRQVETTNPQGVRVTHRRTDAQTQGQTQTQGPRSKATKVPH